MDPTSSRKDLFEYQQGESKKINFTNPHHKFNDLINSRLI